MKKPKQIGERVEVINGQRVTVRVFEAVMPPEPDANPVMASRDDSRSAGQRYTRSSRKRGVDV